MNILISGSSGFLGSHAANYFQSHGHNVTGIDIVAGNNTHVVDDICNFVKNTTQKFDLLIHCAAEVKGRENIEKNYLNMIKNVEIDRCVFEWAITHVSQVIYPSSCAVYPVQYQNLPDLPMSENLVNFQSNTIGVSDHLYGWSKLTAERILWQMHLETSLKIQILRPFSGYGSGQSKDYPMANLVDMVKNNPDNLSVWGTGNQTRDWVHVDDIVKTMSWCIRDLEKYRTINVGTGISTRFLDLIEKIYFLVYSRSCPAIKQLTDRPEGVRHRVANTDLQRRLGIAPAISLEQGIKTLL